jgi:polygalacturonase
MSSRSTLPYALALVLGLSPSRALSSFNVVEYGAVPDGRTMDTAAIAKAVSACALSHGGTIVFPAGRYLTGSITLQSNMTLELEAGCEILYSPDPADSPLVASRWESTNAFTHAPLIYANGAENVSVIGRGTINGQGSNWWWRNGKYAPARSAEIKPAMEAWLALYKRIEAGEKPGVEEFKLAAEYLRPSLVQFYGCRNVLVEGVTLSESPMWMLQPIYSENVSIRGVTFLSTGPNGDGVDIDSCRDVRISDCFFNTGDDGIVIKSGRDADGRRTARPTEHVAITNCVMYNGHGSVAIGSETSGGIRDVVASNIISRGAWYGIRVKSERGRGNTIENLRFDNFVIDGATIAAVEVTALYENEPAEPLSFRTPIFRDIAFSNVTIFDAAQVASIHGLPEKAFERLRFTDVTASGRSGFLCDHSTDVALHDVRVNAAQGSAFAFDKVQGLELDGVSSMTPVAGKAVLDVSDCGGVWLRGSRAAAGTGVFLRHSGDAAGAVRLSDNDLSAAKVAAEPAVP